MNKPFVPGQAVSEAPSAVAAPSPAAGAFAVDADGTAGSEWPGR